MKTYIKKRIKKKIQRRKHHFQLLELMVAAFILLVCIAPAMRIFTSIYQGQQEIVRENQRDHLAHLIHSKVVEMLYKRELHLSEATKKEQIPLNDAELQVQLNTFHYSFEAYLVVLHSRKKKNEEHPNQYLVQLVIKLKDRAAKRNKKGAAKHYENQESNDHFYDVYIYIDAGAKKKKEDQKKQGIESKKNKKDLEEEEEECDDRQDDDNEEEDTSPLIDTNNKPRTTPKRSVMDQQKK
ncbi:MAG: hypothetical protein ACH350_05380 [Parachlamydiaceae bacterium]